MRYAVLKKFNANGADYEIRKWIRGSDVDGVVFIRVFKIDTDMPANGYEYSVSIQDREDARMAESFIDPLESLVEIAENDVIQGVWESYQQTLK